MEIYTRIRDIRNIAPSSVALGYFDGLHIGHRTLISKCLEDAEKHGRLGAVFTFREHPKNVLAGRIAVTRLLSPEDKHRALAEMGVDCLFELPFEAGFHQMPPEVFARDLVAGAFHARAAFCGFNFHFGKNAAGDADSLIDFGEAWGYQTYVLDPVHIRTEKGVPTTQTVSSTLIRERIKSGRVEEAGRLLGGAYSLSGVATPGKQLGRMLGFPTANFPLSPAMTPPAPGVYITRTAVAFEAGACPAVFPSVTNVGVNPTTDQPHGAMVETHLLDWDGELYGKALRVQFLRMLRPEQKFENLDALKAAIAKNAQEARDYFASAPSE
ncbi:MAG: riboflavin biosynthesis protein RibF [Clostridiales Family XIII bacterium]|jgi:riboflavin kinase/FMN adenylyltransferase|nr:riboflavin biosynthesis protein RibF [Clostridiales Family XIII bacterium]